MRPIIGGNVPPERVIGRDDFVKKMWNTLENQSIVLVSERRIGKTSIMRKMEKEPREGWRPIYMVIEGLRSPTEFISKIFDAVSPVLTKRDRILRRLHKLYQEIAGKQIGSWALPELTNNWKRLLRAILKDIRENFDERVVFLWDELPLMISNIKDDHGVRMAMEMLDELRDHRVADDSGKLRMVYTGSIGLHLVISELLHEGYRNDPTNDMVTFSLEGLETEYAVKLAGQGLKALAGEGEIEISDPIENVAETICKRTNRLPYYINYTVVRLSEIHHPIKIHDVEAAIDSLILDPEDSAHFRHYAERIEAYYLFHEHAKNLAFIILEVLCQNEKPMPEGELWNKVVAEIALTDKRFFQKVLGVLMYDHYLNRVFENEERRYMFKYDIIRRWWLKNRG